MNNNWTILNLELPELHAVKSQLEKGDEPAAYLELENYFSSRATKGFLNDTSGLQEKIKKELSDDIKSSADRLTQNIFTFDKPWDMEKCFEPVNFPNKIDWHHKYQGDPEWMFMLNRQNFLLDLILTYLAKDDALYLTTYVHLMEEWLASEPSYQGREGSSWRTIDTGIRLKNWCKQLEFILPQHVLSGELILNILASIKDQIHYMLNVFQFTPNLVLSNWRILEFHGVYIAATLFPELVGAKDNQQKVKKNLETCLPFQVTTDGFHWEQSFMYHHEVLLNAVEAVHVGQNNNDFFSVNFIALLNKMCLASSHAITPQLTQPSYGDSDVEDVRHILTYSALILNTTGLNSFGLLKHADLALECDYGTTAELDLTYLLKKLDSSGELDFVHEDVGNYFVRSAWTEQANFLFFKNGFLGGGHAHNDLLHFDLFLHGQPILVDSGRYTYTEGNPYRQALKESRHHNTLTIDNKEHTIQEGSWGNSVVANEVKRPAKINQDIVLLQGQHLGYAPDAVVNRKLIMLKKCGLTFIADEIFSEQSHHYEQHFHFATPDATIIDQTVNYHTSQSDVTLYPLDQQVPMLATTELSPSYNQLVPTQKAVFEKEATGYTHLNLLIADQTQAPIIIKKVEVKNMHGRILDEKNVSAYRVETADEKYLFVLTHFELANSSRTLYMVEDTPLFGKTIVCTWHENKFVPTVLEY